MKREAAVEEEEEKDEAVFVCLRKGQKEAKTPFFVVLSKLSTLNAELHSSVVSG